MEPVGIFDDQDDLGREMEPKAVYIFSERYSWDRVEVLYTFIGKKQRL